MPLGSKLHTSRPSTDVIAVDWSGAIAGVRKKLWLAQVRDGQLVRLECGRDREEIVAELIHCASSNSALIVGLDFAFSLPEWFLRERDLTDVRALWRLVEREGEDWLRTCHPPFWGRKARRKPAHDPERSPFRHTESDQLAHRGIHPKSVFQIGGAGAVGTGSLRGMPYLWRLALAGFSIWPFDDARLPMVVEIYPRYLTGSVNKSSRVARALYLERGLADQPRDFIDRAASSEDAFDAAVSAVIMAQNAQGLRVLAKPEQEVHRLEGWIWKASVDPTSFR